MVAGYHTTETEKCVFQAWEAWEAWEGGNRDVQGRAARGLCTSSSGRTCVSTALSQVPAVTVHGKPRVLLQLPLCSLSGEGELRLRRRTLF